MPADPPNSDERRVEPDESTDIFDEYVRGDPGVCQGCFRRMFSDEPAPSDRWLQMNTDSPEILKEVAIPRRVLEAGGEVAYPPAREGERPRPRIVCEDCGDVDRVTKGFAAGLLDPGTDPDAPLSKAKLRTVIWRCSRLPQKAGVDVNNVAAERAADRLKSKPKYAGRDADITSVALEIGKRHAGEGEHVEPASTADAEASAEAALDRLATAAQLLTVA